MSPLFPYAHLFRAYVPVGSRLRSAPPPRGATRNRRKGPPPAFPPRPSAGPPPSAHLTDGRCGALRRSPSPLFRLRVDMSLDRLQIGRKRLEPLLAIEQARDPRGEMGTNTRRQFHRAAELGGRGGSLGNAHVSN